MKKTFLLLILLLAIPAFSQSINDYQYVIVPIKFDFLKYNDRYRLNTTTKLLLQKYGFKAFLSTDDIPEEVTSKRCAILYASLVEDNSFFATKIKVVLKDCKEKVVYETDFGTSREKDFAVAYNEAIRNASKSFEKLNYTYNGKNDATNANGIPVVPETPVTPIPVKKDLSETLAAKTQSTETTEAISPEMFFFAQPITNGFQIVNSEPRVIMRLLNTSQKNVFIGVKGNTNGVVILKNDQWFFEYYESGKLVSEPLKLKF
ncbi:hypothetical protein [Flavobacterium sp.]|uniref:hypothetical protein n=1 Tax=Flavobacterium sp. TaxID=239 RepID=UPI002FD8BA6B